MYIDNVVPHRSSARVALVLALVFSAASIADDMVSFATGGYGTGLRTKEMMHKIDTNGDGMVSKDEWLAFQEKVFSMLDKTHSGKIDAKSFSPSGNDAIAKFATGGYARGLLTQEMMTKIDANNDGRISHEEFIAYQTKIFEMMNTSTSHKDMLGPSEFFATGGASPR
jgi:hypothetical protein